MDFIIELVIELLLEGSIEISSNKKVSKWIRYPLILFIVTLFAGIILLMLYLSFSLLNKNALAAILILIISVFMLISAINKLKKIYIEEKIVRI